MRIYIAHALLMNFPKMGLRPIEVTKLVPGEYKDFVWFEGIDKYPQSSAYFTYAHGYINASIGFVGKPGLFVNEVGNVYDGMTYPVDGLITASKQSIVTIMDSLSRQRHLHPDTIAFLESQGF